MTTDNNAKKQLRVAVIGDPHFYREGSTSRSGVSHIQLNETGNFINTQPQQNPWTGLCELVDEQEIRADVLLCVGDITFGAEKVGLVKAWAELQMLAIKMGAGLIASATGNHDVSSRSIAEKVGKNPSVEMSTAFGLFEQLKLLSPSYPALTIKNGVVEDNSLLRTKYFGDSFVLVEGENYRVVILNSCCEHSADAFQQERGSFPKSAEIALCEELKKATEDKINILVCHHSPEPHSEHNLGGHDFIENGEALLQCLEQHANWFIVHGHKHHGRLGYAKGAISSPIVFSTASLGIKLDSAKDGMRNQFYCVDIYQKKFGSLYGQVSAWDWNMGMGWRRATRNTGGIYDGCGFGNRTQLDDLVENIAELVPCSWSEALEKISTLNFLTPNDMLILEKRLLRHNIVVQPDSNGYWSEILKKI